MNDEISFGDYRESQPQVGLPPDRNPHFSIGWVGAVPPAGMPVFVDLDTMRQLELHAQSNVAVELGGVLLGERRLDAAGNPYVVVQDALAAEHYEATRGSFKFTHETWQAISRQREAYPPHLEMIGWYHTHPDWSVFLSSMDLFICDHFFNHPLDLALVIDPIRDDRGWFVWGGHDGKSIERTPGFYLFAHRGRSQELLSVVESYNEVLSMPTDPRFRTVTAAGGSSAPIVHLHERPVAVGFWALGLLAAAQLLLLTWLAVRSTLPPLESTRLEAQLTAWGELRSAEMRAESYRELLVALAERQPDEQGLVARWTAAVESNRQLQTALQGQSALQEKLQSEQAILTAKLTAAEQVGRELERRLSETASEVERLRLAKTSSSVEGEGETASAGPGTPWLVWGVGAGVVLAAAAVGFLLGRRGWWERWSTRERDE